MNPGRQLDARIATAFDLWYPGDKSGCPAYSTEIAAAWQVVEKLKSQLWMLSLHDHGGGQWFAGFAEHDGRYMTNREAACRIADSAPLAICLAALEARRKA